MPIRLLAKHFKVLGQSRVQKGLTLTIFFGSKERESSFSFSGSIKHVFECIKIYINILI